MDTDVIIVGAGPTGLSLASQLVRYGVDFVLIDKKESLTPFSKAIGVQARTLEIYDQLGLAQKAVAEGAIAGKVRFLEGGEIRGEVELSEIGEGLSPYPYVLVLEQSKNEKLLYEFLQSRGMDVLWQTEVAEFSQSDTGVTAHLKDASGAEQTIQAQYLVGCDGAKSPVRHALGLPFEGSTFERIFYVADAQVDWDFGHDALQICLAPQSFVLFFPMKGEKRFRIVGVFPEGYEKDEGAILYDEIEQRIQEETQLALTISNVAWFSTYKVHTRHVSRFSVGRCFLAGDAAHTHSPAGAQGMNTGIQDAYNLAWKLSLVLQGKAGARLLESYNEERLANAKKLLASTDRLFEIGAGTHWLTGLIRTRIFPAMAKYVLDFDVVKKAIFPLLSQIGINYRDSSLSQHGGDQGFHLKAGDRMPFFLMEGASIYRSLDEPKFHLLYFSASENDEPALYDATEPRYAPFLNYQHLPLEEQVMEIFGSKQPFYALLRPDNYICVLTHDISGGEWERYLDAMAT